MKHRETTGINSAEIASKVREILEQAPEVEGCGLGKAFLERMERFADVLAVWGRRTNLTAHPDDPAEVAFHVIDSLAPLFGRPSPASMREGVRVLDLGSGAGFPGLVLAAAGDAHFTLVEARRKRASFLSVAAGEMGLGNVTVSATRVSAASVTTGFDLVTSRAVGVAGLEIMSAALRPGGIAILWISPEQAIDLEQTRELGLGGVLRHEYVVHRGLDQVRRSLVLMQKS